jgi:hypothetical protein
VAIHLKIVLYKREDMAQEAKQDDLTAESAERVIQYLKENGGLQILALHESVRLRLPTIINNEFEICCFTLTDEELSFVAKKGDGLPLKIMVRNGTKTAFTLWLKTISKKMAEEKKFSGKVPDEILFVAGITEHVPSPKSKEPAKV